jgi:hypothetical protein
MQPQEIWERILEGERNMWSTGSLVMGAGRVLAQMDEGWRFVPRHEAGSRRVWRWDLEPIIAKVDADARVSWEAGREGSNALLFRRERGNDYAAAMSEALSAQLRMM